MWPTLTAPRSLLNIKVINKKLRSYGFICFCVHDTAATRGQYLASSKALQSCLASIPIGLKRTSIRISQTAQPYSVQRWCCRNGAIQQFDLLMIPGARTNARHVLDWRGGRRGCVENISLSLPASLPSSRFIRGAAAPLWMIYSQIFAIKSRIMWRRAGHGWIGSVSALQSPINI